MRLFSKKRKHTTSHDASLPTFISGDGEVSAHGVDVTITRSAGADGAVVVFVDSLGVHEIGGMPQMRILLNDGEVYVGVPYEDKED